MSTMQRVALFSILPIVAGPDANNGVPLPERPVWAVTRQDVVLSFPPSTVVAAGKTMEEAMTVARLMQRQAGTEGLPAGLKGGGGELEK